MSWRPDLAPRSVVSGDIDIDIQGASALGAVYEPISVLDAAFAFDDADHLATIDGLTRYNLRMAPGRARWCGSLFSLGHGAIVMLIALGVGLVSTKWHVPAWMEDFGTWISIGFLTLLGILNLRAVLMAPAGVWKKLIVRPGDDMNTTRVEALRPAEPYTYKPMLKRLVCAA